jgi:O-antigen ligase
MGHLCPKKRFAAIFNKTYSTNHQRIEIWMGIVQMVKARPLLGVGIGNFNLLYPFYQTQQALATYGGSTHFIRQAHNEYLQFAAELGLPGLAVFIWFTIILVNGLLRRISTARDPHTAVIYLGLLGSALAVLVTAGFSFNLQTESSALYFWFIVGMAGVVLNESFNETN